VVSPEQRSFGRGAASGRWKEHVMAAEAGTSSAAAETLRAFVNTYDVERHQDAIADPAALLAWLRTARLLADDDATADAGDVALAVRLREGLREVMLAHHDASAGPSSDLDAVAAELPLVVDFGGEPPGFRPIVGGVRGALAHVLALVASTVADGTWDRLKVCAADDCRWAFYDASRNHSRTWCAMGVCGNRQKTRAYRARRREAD
jgi:predicted RNA-binding Zn ribbon-like protein